MTYGFDVFRLDSANRLLLREGEPVTLTARAFDTLLMLVQRPGQLVTKTEMLNAVWANSFVEESNLTVAISTLRRALGEDPHDRKFIQTVSGHGYRFICPIQLIPDAPRPGPVAEPESSPSMVEPSFFRPVSAASPPEDAPAEEQPRRRTGRVLWSLVACSLLIAGAFFAWRVHRVRAAQIQIHTLAVLPISGPGASDYVLLGMTDVLIDHLGSLVAVRPMSSVLKYSGHSVDAREAGREQGADAVVVSHLDQHGNDTDLEVHLVRTSDGQVLWGQRYTDRSDHVAGMLETADQGLAGELSKFNVDAPRTAPPSYKAPVDDAAYQLYLRGRYFWNRRTEDGLQRSIECFKQSIAIAPNYAAAYAGLADSYALLASFSVKSGRAANPDARAAALSAIHLDPMLAEPHASLGMIYFFTDWNGPAAEEEFGRAIALNPNYATAHHWYALDLAAMGRFPQALYEIHRAQTLDPLSLIISTNVGWIEYLNHQNDRSITEYRKVLELDPSFARARTRLGIAEIQKGDLPSAVKDLEEAEKLSGDPYVSGLLGEALAKSGRTAAAEHILHQLQAQSATKYVPPFSIALVELGLSRRREALSALEQSVEDRSTSMVYAKIDPSLDDLRKEPDFQKLVAGMKF